MIPRKVVPARSNSVCMLCSLQIDLIIHIATSLLILALKILNIPVSFTHKIHFVKNTKFILELYSLQSDLIIHIAISLVILLFKILN